MIRRLAAFAGVTEGQLYTVALGLVVSLTLAAFSVPAALRDRPVASASPLEENATVPGPARLGPDPVSLELAAQSANPEVAAAFAGSGTALSTALSGSRSPEPSGRSSGDLYPRRPFGTLSVLAKVGPPGAPEGVAVDAAGRVYVATNNAAGRGGAGPSKVFRFSRSGKFDDALEIKDQPEQRFTGITGLAIDQRGELVALDGSSGRILKIDIDRGVQREYAHIPDIPSCSVVTTAPCEGNARDLAPLPRSAAFDSAGHLYVTDSSQRVIWRIGANGGAAKAWFAPEQSASSSELTGLSIDDDGSVVFASSIVVGPESQARSLVSRVEVSPDGRPGRYTVLARTQVGESIAGLSIGSSGRIYAAMPSNNQILVIESNGTEGARISSALLADGDSPAVFDAPTGVVFRGFSILVSNQSTLRNEANSWSVLDVAVEDSRA